MATLQELIAEKERIEREIQAQQTAQRDAALAEIRSIMDANGLSIADIGGGTARRLSRGTGDNPTKGSKVAAKYRHPETGESWSGRGLKPRWLKAAIEQGRQIEEFAVS
jgi:DNA-binding protein H-NS